MSFSRRPRAPSITFRPALPFSNLRKVVYCCTCVLRDNSKYSRCVLAARVVLCVWAEARARQRRRRRRYHINLIYGGYKAFWMVTGHSLSAILPVRVQAAGSNGRSFTRLQPPQSYNSGLLLLLHGETAAAHLSPHTFLCPYVSWMPCPAHRTRARSPEKTPSGRYVRKSTAHSNSCNSTFWPDLFLFCVCKCWWKMALIVIVLLRSKYWWPEKYQTIFKIMTISN